MKKSLRKGLGALAGLALATTVACSDSPTTVRPAETVAPRFNGGLYGPGGKTPLPSDTTTTTNATTTSTTTQCSDGGLYGPGGKTCLPPPQ